MTRETWLMMVKVARQKRGEAVEPNTLRRRKQRPSLQLQMHSIREDHYALLVAAQY